MYLYLYYLNWWYSEASVFQESPVSRIICICICIISILNQSFTCVKNDKNAVFFLYSTTSLCSSFLALIEIGHAEKALSQNEPIVLSHKKWVPHFGAMGPSYWVVWQEMGPSFASYATVSPPSHTDLLQMCRLRGFYRFSHPSWCLLCPHVSSSLCLKLC